MKQIIIALIILCSISLFADSYKYSADIVGKVNRSEVTALETAILNGTDNIFTDGHVKLVTTATDGGQVILNVTITGLLQNEKKVDVITFSGDIGRVNVTWNGSTVPILVEAEDTLSVVLSEFVNQYRNIFKTNYILISNTATTITFTSAKEGIDFDSPTLENVSGDLEGVLVNENEAKLSNVDNIDMLIWKFFYNTIAIDDFEIHHNRDFY